MLKARPPKGPQSGQCRQPGSPLFPSSLSGARGCPIRAAVGAKMALARSGIQHLINSRQPAEIFSVWQPLNVGIL